MSPLVAHEALTTAYINDVDGLGVFAQQLFGFGRPKDVFLAIVPVYKNLTAKYSLHRAILFT